MPYKPEAMARVLSVFFAASVQLSAANEILLASFDGAKGSTHQWRQMNDPVMGGKSTGTFSVADSKGIFSGEVVDVPFLKAPGFIKASVVDMNPFGRIFPDISTCKNIALRMTTRDFVSPSATHMLLMESSLHTDTSPTSTLGQLVK